MTTCLDAEIIHDGDPPFLKVARIDHAFKDGCHIFTSEEIPGLLVACQSLEKAIKQLPAVIAVLVESNLGFKCKVQLATRIQRKDGQPDEAVITKLAA